MDPKTEIERQKQDFMEGLDIPTPTPPINVDPPTPTPTPTPEPPIDPPAPIPTPTPPIDPPADPINPIDPPAPAAPSIELNDDLRVRAINELYGTAFTNVDEAKAFHSEYGNLKKEVEDMRQLPVDRFANDEIRELNRWASTTGITDKTLIQELKVFEATSEKDPIQALVLKDIINNPANAKNKDILYKMYKRQYAAMNVDLTLLEGDELDEARDNAEVTRMKLEIEANNAKNEISEKVAKVGTGTTETIGQQYQGVNEKVNQWVGLFGNEANQEKLFSKIPGKIPVGVDEQGNPVFEDIGPIELSKDDQKYYAQLALDMAKVSGKELSEENAASVMSLVYDAIKGKYAGSIATKLASKREAAFRLQQERAIHNPSQIKVETPPAPPAQEVNVSDAIEAQIIKQYGG